MHVEHTIDDNREPSASEQSASHPIGTATVRLKLRAGPGLEHAVVQTLPPETPVEVSGQQGVWLRVKAQGIEGYVHRNFVVFPDGTEIDTIPQLPSGPADIGETPSVTEAPQPQQPGQPPAPSRSVPSTAPVSPRGDDQGGSDTSFLPPPIPGDEARTLAKVDPKLYEYWREHIRAGFERNNEMFIRVLNGFMEPYYTTIWMYRILFSVGILSFLAAAGLSMWTRNASFSLVFGGLSVAAFLTYFLSRPLRALEENLEFITWLGLVYNTYWTRLAYTMDEKTVQQDLAKANKDATDEIQRIIDKHTELSKQRPGLG